MTTELKIYGHQRSGTNYLVQLVERNFDDVRVWHHGPGWTGGVAPGWKHGEPIRLEGMAGYLLMIKHPVAWIDSMLRYQPDALTVLCRVWNRGAKWLVDFANANRSDVVLVDYEDLLGAPLAWVETIAEAFGLPKPEELQDVARECLRGGDEMRGDKGLGPNRFRRREHFLECKYWERFGEAQLATIVDSIDAGLAEELGYEMEAPR